MFAHFLIIHPRNEQDVGRCLALNALAKEYSRNIEFTGSTFAKMRVESNGGRVEFAHAKGLRTSDGEAPKTIGYGGRCSFEGKVPDLATHAKPLLNHMKQRFAEAQV